MRAQKPGRPAPRVNRPVTTRALPDDGAVSTDAVDSDASTPSRATARPDAGEREPEPESEPPAKPSESAEPRSGNPPCEVAGVLKKHCAQCHGKALRLGAPFSLTTAADFQGDAGSAVLRRVRDDVRPMPPPPAARLSADEVAALASWIDEGARAAQPGCSVDDAPAEDPRDPDDPNAGVVTRPQADDAGSGEPDASTDMRDAGPQPETELSDWPMFGADLANSRDNVHETALTPDNVAELRELWRFDGPATSSAPAVVDGVVYLPGWNGRVYAMALEDGSAVWTAELPHLIDSSPTVTETQVFVSDDDGNVHALDRATGEVQWSERVHDHEEAHLWSSPMYVPSASLLVVGIASGEEQVAKVTYTFRGAVVGLDAESGEVRWRFETASADADFGPGVGSWGTAAVDEQRKLVFIGTGNNYQPPYSDYSDSLLAIDYETGELAWSRQFTEADAYTIYGGQGPDYDIGSSANLFSIDGEEFVGIGIKSGHYFALRRDTGEIAWRTTITSGSVLGGVISASAYAGGLIFVASNDYLVSSTVVAALDARDGSILWSDDVGQLTYGGVAHANGVVFVGSTSGSIYAFDAASGDLRWVDQAPNAQSIAGSPTVASGRLLVPWGYQWTLREGRAGSGGLTVYGL